jgi:hypothetical protein
VLSVTDKALVQFLDSPGRREAAGGGHGWKILNARSYYNGMKQKLIKTHKERWEQGLAALSKFRKRKRHCCPSRHHLEGKFKLGRWVNTQRYFKDDLSVERKKRLDRIGFVWNWREYLWERGFAALLKFKRREGHCRVPIRHREGNFRLGYWVSTQRRKRTELPALRKRRLNKIGFVWREHRGYLRLAVPNAPPPRARTSRSQSVMSAFDPKRTSGKWHFANI